MSWMEYFSPPPWAVPMYTFELMVLFFVMLQSWLFWDTIRDAFSQKLSPRRPPRAPPVGQ